MRTRKKKRNKRKNNGEKGKVLNKEQSKCLFEVMEIQWDNIDVLIMSILDENKTDKAFERAKTREFYFWTALRFNFLFLGLNREGLIGRDWVFN